MEIESGIKIISFGLNREKLVYFLVHKLWVFKFSYPVCSSEIILSFELEIF